MKAIFGAALLATPFLAIAAVGVSQVGLAWTLISFGLAGASMVIIWGGVVLISQ